MSIQLILGSLSVTLAKFPDNKLPRAVVEPHAGLEYSIYGTSIGDGPRVEPKFIWSVNAFVDQNQEALIGAIYFEFDLLRRTQPYTPAEVRLIDTNQKYQERLPRTRAIASGTTATNIGSSHVSYFAQFNVWFVKPPDFTELGRIRTVNLTFQESSKVPA